MGDYTIPQHQHINTSTHDSEAADTL